jgi:hypothetical protein
MNHQAYSIQVSIVKLDNNIINGTVQSLSPRLE